MLCFQQQKNNYTEIRQNLHFGLPLARIMILYSQFTSLLIIFFNPKVRMLDQLPLNLPAAAFHDILSGTYHEQSNSIILDKIPMASWKPKPFSTHLLCFWVQSILLLPTITWKKMMSSPGCRYGQIFSEDKESQTSRPVSVCIPPKFLGVLEACGNQQILKFVICCVWFFEFLLNINTCT